MTAPEAAASPALHRVAPQDEAIAYLASGAAFGTAEAPKRIETHGAMVFLSGDTALKLKKAVRFPFMDFSTVDKRREACMAEVAINRRFAPALYRDCVPIKRLANGDLCLSVDAEGEILDWVVRMARFDETATFDHLAASGALNGALVDEMAKVVAALHQSAPERGAPIFLDMLARTLDENVDAFGEASHLIAARRAEALDRRLRERLALGAGLIAARAVQGLVRRCHGDLHLRNIALVGGRPQPFDAIEFNEAIASGDVLYDLAFLLMDLWERGHKSEANRLFNGYLLKAGRDADLDGLALLPLYLAVRATIRAKVALAAAEDAEGPHARVLLAEANAYFDAAEGFAAPAGPRLVAIGGLSGTGKTSLARQLAAGIGPAPGAVILRSDTTRKALFGVAPTDPLPPEAYAAEVSERVFAELARKARQALAAGHGVIADAVFARVEERMLIERVAIDESVPFIGLFLEAPLGIRLSRIEARVGDASDARATVATAQESYDLGPMAWSRIDAAADIDLTAESAQRVLAART